MQMYRYGLAKFIYIELYFDFPLSVYIDNASANVYLSPFRENIETLLETHIIILVIAFIPRCILIFSYLEEIECRLLQTKSI